MIAMRPYVVERRFVMKAGSFATRRCDCDNPERCLAAYDTFMNTPGTTGVAIYRRVILSKGVVRMDPIHVRNLSLNENRPDREFGLEIFELPGGRGNRPQTQQVLTC